MSITIGAGGNPNNIGPRLHIQIGAGKPSEETSSEEASIEAEIPSTPLKKHLLKSAKPEGEEESKKKAEAKKDTTTVSGGDIT